MIIPINATVYCQDQEVGKINCVIFHPIRKEITHVVIKEKGLIGLQRLVPVEKIIESKDEKVTLICSPKGMADFKPFTEGHFIGGKDPYQGYEAEQYYYHPMIAPSYTKEFEYEPLLEEQERIPPGELGIHRGAEVFATDGKIGKVDEFLILPEDDKISHLVLREGHLWGERQVTIPVSEIDHIETDQVYLKLTKQAVERLPAVPVRRHIHV